MFDSVLNSPVSASSELLSLSHQILLDFVVTNCADFEGVAVLINKHLFNAFTNIS